MRALVERDHAKLPARLVENRHVPGRLHDLNIIVVSEATVRKPWQTGVRNAVFPAAVVFAFAFAAVWPATGTAASDTSAITAGSPLIAVRNRWLISNLLVHTRLCLRHPYRSASSRIFHFGRPSLAAF
jgi:hypothetical protein